jgi:hypothetical protein
MMLGKNGTKHARLAAALLLTAGGLLGAVAGCGSSEGGGDAPGMDAGDTDGATPPPDGGGADLGGPGEDGGTPDEDGGTPDEDGGTPDEDGGTPDEDGGTPDEDGGTPDEDGGMAPDLDAGRDGGGTVPVDGGRDGSITPVVDGGGTVPVDGGRDGSITPVVDGGGTVPVDGGRDGSITPVVDGGGADACTPTAYYRDCDRDGFAPASDPVRSCDTPTTPPPCGLRMGVWITRAPTSPDTTDCNDTNATVNPAQTMFMSMAIPGAMPAVDFDYDCNAREEREFTTIGVCRPASSTEPGSSPCEFVAGWTGPSGGGIDGIPECGETRNWLEGCRPMGSGMMTTCVPFAGTRTQRCR